MQLGGKVNAYYNTDVELLTFEHFLWLQAGLVFFGVIYLLRRSSRTGMRLRWKPRGNRMIPSEMTTEPRMWNSQQPTAPRHRPTTQEQTKPAPNHRPNERTLNVFFNFNGHSWDAFEVLGLPAGSSLDKVDAALQAALARSEVESREFYKLACDAIHKSRIIGE